MSLTAYQIFNTIAEQKSILRTSEILHITPSAVSHSLSMLESELGFRLVNRARGTSEISLTPNGYSVLKFVRAILSSEKALREEVSSLNNLLTGTVSIGTLNSICVAWIPRLLRDFGVSHPTISIRILQGGYNFIESQISNNIVDFGFVSAPTFSDLDQYILFDDPIFCIAPKDFVPIHKTYVTPEDFKNTPFLLAKNSYDYTTQEFLKKNEIRPNLYHETSTDASTIALVENGFGISFVPKLVLDTEKPTACQLFPIDGLSHRKIAIATSKNSGLSPAAECFFLFIKDYANMHKF